MAASSLSRGRRSPSHQKLSVESDGGSVEVASRRVAWACGVWLGRAACGLWLLGVWLLDVRPGRTGDRAEAREHQLEPGGLHPGRPVQQECRPAVGGRVAVAVLEDAPVLPVQVLPAVSAIPAVSDISRSGNAISTAGACGAGAPGRGRVGATCTVCPCHGSATAPSPSPRAAGRCWMASTASTEASRRSVSGIFGIAVAVCVLKL